MRGSTLSSVVAATALLTACQTTNYDAGNTPIEISQKTAAAFERYKSTTRYPNYFAVATNGNHWGFNTCPSSICVSGGDRDAVERRNRGGTPCKVFAAQGKIVWKEPIKWPVYRYNEYPLILTRKKSSGNVNYIGKATANSFGDVYRLVVKYEYGYCYGPVPLNSGTWKLSCSKGKTIAGTFVTRSKNILVGVGKDDEGRTVELEITNKIAVPEADDIILSIEAPAVLPGTDLCERALDVSEDNLAWRTDKSARELVNEAIRRGFTVNSCRKEAQKLAVK